MQRLRRTESLRRLAAETAITPDHLILPLFVVSGVRRVEDVAAMPGVRRYSADALAVTADELRSRAVLLFGVPDPHERDAAGSAAFRGDGLVPKAVQALKARRPDLVVITDVCLCTYTDHGHCGILAENGQFGEAASLCALARMAEAHAAAGADLVAPSAMMDGQVATIRDALDAAGFAHTGIMSYAAKFASSFYGPFREAAHSAPSFGNRRAYQLPPSNRREAIRDALLDEREGADWLMVKPALPYLDVLMELRAATRLPIAAYQVSGEYAMLKRGAQDGLWNERDAVLESVLAIKRAGADAIITYYAEEIIRWIDE